MNSFLQWITAWGVRQSLGAKKGSALEASPVFQAAASVILPHLVHQAGGDKLTRAVTQVDQVVQLIQAGAAAQQQIPQPGQVLGDGFVVPPITVGGLSWPPPP